MTRQPACGQSRRVRACKLERQGKRTAKARGTRAKGKTVCGELWGVAGVVSWRPERSGSADWVATALFELKRSFLQQNEVYTKLASVQGCCAQPTPTHCATRRKNRPTAARAHGRGPCLAEAPPSRPKPNLSALVNDRVSKHADALIWTLKLEQPENDSLTSQKSVFWNTNESYC
jgi:hypothetical protein